MSEASSNNPPVLEDFGARLEMVFQYLTLAQLALMGLKDDTLKLEQERGCDSSAEVGGMMGVMLVINNSLTSFLDLSDLYRPFFPAPAAGPANPA